MKLTIALAAAGLLTSLLSLVFTNDCGPGCQHDIIIWLPLLGILYFLVAAFLAIRQHYILIWLLSIGVGAHTGLNLTYITSGLLCPWCLVVYAVNIATLLSVIIYKSRKQPVMSFSVVILASLIVFQATPSPSFSDNLLVNNQGAVVKTSIVASEAKLAADVKPAVITVYDPDGEPVQIDVSARRMLLWSPHCDSCVDVLPDASRDTALVAVWIEGEEATKLAWEKAASLGRKTYIAGELTDMDIKQVKQIPAIVKWDPKQLQIIFSRPDG